VYSAVKKQRESEIFMTETYEICIEGHLHSRWFDWFPGFTVTNLENGQARLSGAVRDQAELLAALGRLHDLNLKLVAVNRVERSR
jgi:hypothetical protein